VGLDNVNPNPTRVRAAALLPPIDYNKPKKKSGRKEKQHEFLGNSRLDNIVGLFKRTEIIHGDKKIRKQIRNDRKVGGGKVKFFT